MTLLYFKSLKIYGYIIVCIIWFCLTSRNAKSQEKDTVNNQSLIYDAISFINAIQKINVLIIPTGGDLYSVYDPLKGTLLLENGKKSDMLQLIKAHQGDDNKAIIESILKKYMAENSNSDKRLRSAYYENPFISRYFASNKKIADTTISTAQLFSLPTGAKIDYTNLSFSPPVSLTGGGSGNLMGNLANGTADFLIKRATEELNVAVFQKLKDVLSKYGEFSILFPNTLNLLDRVEAFNYAASLKAIQEAFRKDFNNILIQAPELSTLPKYQALVKKIPELTTFFVAAQIVAGLKSNQDIPAILHTINKASYVNLPQTNEASFYKMIALLSDGLRKTTAADSDKNTNKYISLEELNDYGKNDSMLVVISNVFFGFYYEQIKALNFHDTEGERITIDSLINPENTGYQTINKIMTTIQVISKNEEQIKAILDKEESMQYYNSGGLRNLNRLSYYVNITDQVFQLATPLLCPSKPSPEVVKIKESIETISNIYLPATRHLIEMAKALEIKEYNTAVYEFSMALEPFSLHVNYLIKNKREKQEVRTSINTQYAAYSTTNNSVGVQKDKLNKLIKSAAQTPGSSKDDVMNAQFILQKTINEQETELKKRDKRKETDLSQINYLARFTEYTNIAASIALAENGDQVKQILETSALPSGSSRVKKNTTINVAVNAYVGWFAGRDQNVGKDGSGFTNRYGITAPIGFTVSTGFDKAGSISAFIGAFDLGTVVRFKLDSTGKYDENVKFSNILSPSLHLAYGFPYYLPLTVGAGVQWATPANTLNDKIQLKPYFNLFIAVDIPLFNLYSRKKYVYGQFRN